MRCPIRSNHKTACISTQFLPTWMPALKENPTGEVTSAKTPQTPSATRLPADGVPYAAYPFSLLFSPASLIIFASLTSAPARTCFTGTWSAISRPFSMSKAPIVTAISARESNSLPT